MTSIGENEMEQLQLELEAAEARVRNALRAVDGANDELRRARQALIKADKAYTRATLNAEVGR
jgi:outer membrane protein TolC